MLSTIPLEEKIARYQRLYTGAVSDVLDELGAGARALPASIRPLRPGQRLSGVAMPVYGEPSSATEPRDVFVPILQMLGALEAGQVIVTQANDSVAAHLGELCAETARYRGGRGAVIHGGVRDADAILRLGFPVFACYTTPLDVVVADGDGVLVIPDELSDEVLLRAEAILTTEDLVRTAILAGVHPLEAYDRYARF